MVVQIYKALTADAASSAEATGRVEAPVDRTDGYVHFSTASQIGETLSKWFRGERGVVLLAYDADGFGSALRWEPSRGGDLFPHVYGEVWLAAALRRWTLDNDADGAPLPPAEVLEGSTKDRSGAGE
ncbi:DUF952 domain-containing protein [bacterium]|nr:DUF952 domain-containing protein [bacterium]